MKPVFHIIFGLDVVGNGFTAVVGCWEQKPGRERKEHARERKGNRFWVRLIYT